MKVSLLKDLDRVKDSLWIYRGSEIGEGPVIPSAWDANSSRVGKEKRSPKTPSTGRERERGRERESERELRVMFKFLLFLSSIVTESFLLACISLELFKGSRNLCR
jgi:hypothetical protein